MRIPTAVLSLVSLLSTLIAHAADLRFTDVTAAARIEFKHRSGGSDKKFIHETISGGLVFLDYDNDGRLDLYLVNGSTLEAVAGQEPAPRNALFRNRGDGSFEDVTEKAGVGGSGAWGMGACAADYDNDGDTDLYVTNYFGPNILYRNNGNGSFSQATAGARLAGGKWSTGCAFADYDRDGYLDLFVAGYVEVDPKRLPQPGENKYCQYRGVPVMCGPRGLKGAPDFLFRNNGDGTFSDVSRQAGVADEKGYYGLGVVWGDYNNDGWPDLYVANDSTPNYLYKNKGDGSFEEMGLMSGTALSGDGREQAGMGVDFGDYDGDGRLDIYVTNFSDDSNTLYRNEGEDNFADVTYQAGHGESTWSYLGWGTGMVDLDNDGDLEIFVANGHVYPQVDEHSLNTSYRQRRLVFENLGGKFKEIGGELGGVFAEKHPSRGAAFGDYDNDGDLDIALSNMDEGPTLLRNDSGHGNNWLSIKLIGTRSNRDAVGARVRVKFGDRGSIAEVKAGSSYLSQNDLRLHFGLGKSAVVELVEVLWPSGARQTLEQVKANQLLTIVEK